jgi:hypothetical protein
MTSSLNVTGRRDCASSVFIAQDPSKDDRLRRQAGETCRLFECRYRGVPGR